MKVAYVYVTDERGFELTLYSAMSLRLSQEKPIDIFVFCYNFNPENRLSEIMLEAHSNLEFCSISDPELENHETCGHVTTPSLLKLSAVSRLINDYNRVVYLDSDILVFKNISPEVMDFGQAPIAAVVDMDLSRTGFFRNLILPINLNGSACSANYFNSGFMVFASENWSSTFLEKYSFALNQHDACCRYKLQCTSIDQCALNSTFEDKWIMLASTFNMQASAKFTKMWKSAIVRHYCGARKFLPVSFFRNDFRDVSKINVIQKYFVVQKIYFSSMYGILFQLNIFRNIYRSSQIQKFLHAVDIESSVRPQRGR